MKKIVVLALAGAVVAALVIVLSSGGSSGGQEQGAYPPPTTHEFDDFPLWREVPGHAFAKLGEGKLPNGTRWAAYVSKTGAGRSGRENPTLTVARITGYGQYDKSIAGGPLAPFREGWSPVTAMLSIFTTSQAKGQTIMAMSFKPSITSIRITLANGEVIRRRTHLLNRYQRHKTHLLSLRYVALGVERELCIAKVLGYGADGKVAFEGRYKKCHPIPLNYSVIHEEDPSLPLG